ncbi:MAG: hypothetical protein R3F56_16840 [Planctomycetota bacterium]
MKPASTGIPGEEVRLVRVAPDGLLWVGARWPFWSEGGFGLYHRPTDTWTTLSNVDGSFPSAFPNDIAWAGDGSAWIATGNGLLHYDRGRRTLYTAANAPLLHDDVRSVAIDLRGHVWLNNSTVNSNSAAIFEFDGAIWRRYTVGVELPWSPPWNALSDVLVDHLGHVWVANNVLNGVAEFDGASWTLHGGSVGRFGEIAEDTAGNIWLRAGVGGGNSFWKFDRSTFTRYPIATTPTAIGIDDNGAVYLGDWLGTIRRSTDFGASFQVWATGLNQVFDITPDPTSTDVWVGTIGAVGHFDGNGNLIRDYNSYNTGICDYFIDDFDVDREGNVWVATGEGGLSRFDGRRWRNWGEHNAGSEPYPFAGNDPMGAFYLDRNGTGWMGGNGIARWDPRSGQFTGFWDWRNNTGMGVTMFVEFAEDAQGVLFAGAENGAVFRFNGSLWVREPIQAYVFSNLPGMATDSRGDVWVAAWFDVWHWDGATWSTVPLPNPNFFFDLGGINVMAIGPDDVKWFGTDEGVVRYDGQTFAVFDQSNSPLPAPQVAGIAVRSDGVLGLAALDFNATPPFPNGVAIVAGDIANPAAWQTWSYGTSPLPHYQLGRCRFDAEGSLWVSAISEGAAVLRHPAQRLRSDLPSISASVGGSVRLELDAGAAGAQAVFALLGSLSGTRPGTRLPSGGLLPLNLDGFSTLSSSLPGFVGTLDAQGRAAATFTLPRIPSATGVLAHFAWVEPTSWTASNAVSLALTP